MLPTGIRRATLIVLALGAVVGFQAAAGVGHAVEVDTLREQTPPFNAFELPGVDKKAAEQAAIAFHLAFVHGIEAMRVPYGVVAFFLAMACALVFVSGIRLLRPSGVARDAVRQLLGTTALVAAVLRTINGAQEAAIFRKAGGAIQKELSGSPALGPLPDGTMAWFYALAMAGLTFVVAGALLAMSMYFRSNSVRDRLLALDKETETAD
jgi:hypothetical protein